MAVEQSLQSNAVLNRASKRLCVYSIAGCKFATIAEKSYLVPWLLASRFDFDSVIALCGGPFSLTDATFNLQSTSTPATRRHELS